MKHWLWCALALAFHYAHAAEDATALGYRERVAPLLERYCTDCHGVVKQKAKLSLIGSRTAEQLAAGGETWFRVLEKVESGEMPPPEEEQPTPAERQAIAAWIRGDFTQLMLAKQRREGRSKVRRLTRNEYANTIEDLFGVRPRVELHLPTDGLVDGYDKVSQALPLSSDGALGFLKLTEETLRWTFKPLPKSSEEEATRVVHAAAMESGESPGHSLVLDEGTVVSFNSDNTSGRLKFPGVKVPGVHHLRFSVYGFQTEKPLPFGIYAGKTGAYPQEIRLVGLGEAPPGRPAVLEADVYLHENDGLRLIPFGLGVPVPKNSQAVLCRAPGLAVQWMEAIRPALPLLAERWLTADFPAALVQELRTSKQATLSPDGRNKSKATTVEAFRVIVHSTFRRVGARLFRRDLTAAELAAFTEETMRQATSGVPLEQALLSQITEMMMAPEFLCVIETPGRLSDFALASRLSYLLWSSTPDEPLLELARRGHLHEPKVLAEQTDRMLADRKARRFTSDLADQWLGLRAIAETSPDGTLYPGYDELLRFSSVQETRAFLRTMLEENRGARELVAADWTWLNEPLAALYRVPGVNGLEMQRVTLPGFSPYGGLWTQSAIMKVTANGTSTSPVKRGVWFAERMLGVHIPPPPPGAGSVEPDTRGAKTLREQLDLHRRDASCSACHARFDPYGFALESFDVIGGFRKAFREVDPELAKLSPEQRKGRPLWRAGLPVDCSGTTPEGEPFGDIFELRRLVAAKPERLALGWVRHLVTYATGTPPSAVDEPALQAIVQKCAGDGYPMRSLLHQVIQSELFVSK